MLVGSTLAVTTSEANVAKRDYDPKEFITQLAFLEAV